MSVFRAALDVYTDGESLDDNVLNRPVLQLLENTLWLREYLTGLASGKGLLLPNVVVESGALVGQPVYWKSATSRFELAVADGTEKQNVVGLVFSKSSNTIATLATLGWHDIALANALSGSVASVRYFLSTSVPGRLVSTQPTPSIVACIADGAGKVFVLPQVADLAGPTGPTGATGATGPSYAATSTTSLLIGTGTKAFTTQAGLAYLAGARVRASSAANTANWMEGVVTAYSSTTLTVSVDLVGGSGTLADWNINLAGARGATGATGPEGPQGTLAVEGLFDTLTGNTTDSYVTIADVGSGVDAESRVWGSLLVGAVTNGATFKVTVTNAAGTDGNTEVPVSAAAIDGVSLDGTVASLKPPFRRVKVEIKSTSSGQVSAYTAYMNLLNNIL